MNQTQKRVLKVLENMKNLVEQDSDYADNFSEILQDGLDDIHGNDGFGTEGQSDPRGDFRNGEWNMKRVEGVD